MTVADYQESLNIIEPYREVWVCVPELVNKTITIDVLWPIILLGLQISDSWYPLDTAHSKCPWNWGKKNMKPGHKNVHLGFELEPTTSNETLQPAKFQLSNSQPQNHPTGPPVGRLIPSTEMHCNQFPSTQTCSLRKNLGLLGSIPPYWRDWWDWSAK